MIFICKWRNCLGKKSIGIYKELLEWINEFSRVTRYEINIQNSILLLYTSNEKSKVNIKTIPFTIASKILKELIEGMTWPNREVEAIWLHSPSQNQNQTSSTKNITSNIPELKSEDETREVKKLQADSKLQRTSKQTSKKKQNKPDRKAEITNPWMQNHRHMCTRNNSERKTVTFSNRQSKSQWPTLMRWQHVKCSNQEFKITVKKKKLSKLWHRKTIHKFVRQI